MSNSDLQAVREDPLCAIDAEATARGTNRVKGLSSWRGAKIGAVAFPAWAGLVLGLEIMIDWPVVMDATGDWVLFPAALLIYGAVFGFFFGLFSGATVGVACELFGARAAVASGFVIPPAIAAGLLEWRLSFDLWDSPGQHISEFGVLILVTVLPLIIIVRQHVRVLNYAVSTAKFQRTP